MKLVECRPIRSDYRPVVPWKTSGYLITLLLASATLDGFKEISKEKWLQVLLGQELYYLSSTNRRFSPHTKSSATTNLVPRVLSYPSLRSERERHPGWVWSRGPRTKLIPREESFVSQFFCLVRFHRSRNDRKGKTDLLSFQL